MSGELRQLAKAAITGDGLTKEEGRLAGRLLFTYGWRASAFAFFLWSLGALERFGVGGGFVYAADATKFETKLREQSTEVRAINRRLLESDIMVTLKESCAAPQKEYFRQRLREQQRDYAGLNNDRELSLPSCETLGIKPSG
jgi:hypothetical protein